MNGSIGFWQHATGKPSNDRIHTEFSFLKGICDVLYTPFKAEDIPPKPSMQVHRAFDARRPMQQHNLKGV